MDAVFRDIKLTRFFYNRRTHSMFSFGEYLSYDPIHQIVDIFVRNRHVVGMLYSKFYKRFFSVQKLRYGDNCVTVAATCCTRWLVGGYPPASGALVRAPPLATTSLTLILRFWLTRKLVIYTDNYRSKYREISSKVPILILTISDVLAT